MEPDLPFDRSARPDSGPMPDPDDSESLPPGTLGSLLQELVGELRALRREVAELAAQQAGGPELADPGEAGPGLAALRVDLADALEAVRDRVVGTVTETVDLTAAALTETTAGVASVMREVRESLLDRLEEHHGIVRARLAEVAAQSQAGTVATRHTQERLAALTTSTNQVRQAVQSLQEDRKTQVVEEDVPPEGAAGTVLGSSDDGQGPVDVAPAALSAATVGLVEAWRERHGRHGTSAASAASDPQTQSEPEPPIGSSEVEGDPESLGGARTRVDIDDRDTVVGYLRRDAERDEYLDLEDGEDSVSDAGPGPRAEPEPDPDPEPEPRPREPGPREPGPREPRPREPRPRVPRPGPTARPRPTPGYRTGTSRDASADEPDAPPRPARPLPPPGRRQEPAVRRTPWWRSS